MPTRLRIIGYQCRGDYSDREIIAIVYDERIEVSPRQSDTPFDWKGGSD